jgi:hypothetical protein
MPLPALPDMYTHAQVGACVPAESLALTPVDAIFVRMGAKVRAGGGSQRMGGAQWVDPQDGS